MLAGESRHLSWRDEDSPPDAMALLDSWICLVN